MYNEAMHIQACLESLKTQTYPRIEIICVDDGSTDETKTIASIYADTIIPLTHNGPAHARNTGAHKAKGEILLFIDADIYLDPSYVTNITKPLIHNHEKATYPIDENVANVKNIWSRCFQIDNDLPLTERIRADEKGRGKKIRAIWKTEFLQTHGYTDNVGYGEDEVLTSADAAPVSGALSYHYNPDTLTDVFLSARWMGRSKSIHSTLRNFFRYSIINSLVQSIRRVLHGAPMAFLIYKIVFDAGFMSGMILKNQHHGFAK